MATQVVKVEPAAPAAAEEPAAGETRAVGLQAEDVEAPKEAPKEPEKPEFGPPANMSYLQARKRPRGSAALTVS